jgi:hypothetical protein
MSAKDEIKSVEDRLEKRRELIARRFEDVKLEVSSAASKAVRSWPVLAVAGGLAAGYAISRGTRHRASVPASIQYVPVRSADGASPARSRGLFAAILAMAATAIKIGTSHEARVFYNAVKRFRERRRHRY